MLKLGKIGIMQDGRASRERTRLLAQVINTLRRFAKVDLCLTWRQSFKRLQHVPHAGAGVDKACVVGATHDEQHTQGKALLGTGRGQRALQLAAHGDSLENERPVAVPHQLPRLQQYLGGRSTNR